MKPALKALGTKRLKLKYDGPLSNLAFTFNLRLYKMARVNHCGARQVRRCTGPGVTGCDQLCDSGMDPPTMDSNITRAALAFNSRNEGCQMC
jgi:hypothetical protein